MRLWHDGCSQWSVKGSPKCSTQSVVNHLINQLISLSNFLQIMSKFSIYSFLNFSSITANWKSFRLRTEQDIWGRCLGLWWILFIIVWHFKDQKKFIGKISPFKCRSTQQTFFIENIHQIPLRWARSKVLVLWSLSWLSVTSDETLMEFVPDSCSSPGCDYYSTAG